MKAQILLTPACWRIFLTFWFLWLSFLILHSSQFEMNSEYSSRNQSFLSAKDVQHTEMGFKTASVSNQIEALSLWVVGFESIKWQVIGVNLKTYLRIYALQWSLISNSCLQRLCLLIVGLRSTWICGSINYLRLAIFIKTFKTTSSDHYFSTMNWIIPTIWVWIAWPFVLELPALLRPFLRCNFSN